MPRLRYKSVLHFILLQLVCTYIFHKVGNSPQRETALILKVLAYRHILPALAGCEKWLLSCTSARFGRVLWLPARIATETLAGEDKAPDSAGCSGRSVAGILAPIQSQGDSRWVRSPLKSNLSKAVEESQHGRGNGRPAQNEKKTNILICNRKYSDCFALMLSTIK